MKITSFWFRSDLELVPLCEKLRERLALGEVFIDAENLYEWGEADALDETWTLNISRKHRRGAPLPEVPYHVHVRGQRFDEGLLARVMADVARAIVFRGRIECRGGDEYDYFPSDAGGTEP